MEPSFVGDVIDRMIRVPDAAAVASIRHLESLIGRRAGASTGTGLWAAYTIADEMRRRGESGSVVGLLCDGGERYLDKYYSSEWLAAESLDPPLKVSTRSHISSACTASTMAAVSGSERSVACVRRSRTWG